MQHLITLNHHTSRNSGSSSTTPTTSPAYDALATRIGMPHAFLDKVLDAGWLTDPQEMGANQRSVLLAYLGTFDEPLRFSSNAPDDAMLARFNDRTRPPGGVAQGHMDLALRLLDMGVYPWARDMEGRDVLDQTFSLQWWPLFDRLWSDPARPDAAELMTRTLAVTYVHSPMSSHRPMELPWLHAAVALGRDTMVTTLLDAGFDVNQLDAQGRSPLFYAIRPSSVGLLLEHGADVGVIDRQQRNVVLHWATPRDQDGAMDLRSEDQAAMTRRLQAALDAHREQHPEAAVEQNRRVLFELATTGTKDNLVKHLRTTGLSANESCTQDGRTVSLLAVASLAVIEDRRSKRSTAIAQHVLERVDDPWFESFPGVPDVVLAWLASCVEKTDNKLVAVTEERLSQRYGWDQEQGFVRFLEVFLPMAERLIASTQPISASAVNPIAQAVAAAELRAAGQLHGRTPLPEAMRGWHRACDVDQHNYAWRWASVAAQGCMGAITPGTSHLVDSNMEYWATGSYPSGSFRGDVRYTTPVAAIGAMGLHAMLVHLGHVPQPGSLRKGYGDTVLAGMFVSALHRGAVLDSSLPGFEARMERIRAQRPEVARDLESRVLRQEAQQHTSHNAPTARARSRL